VFSRVIDDNENSLAHFLGSSRDSTYLRPTFGQIEPWRKPMLTIAQSLDMAVQHHRAGRVVQAEQFYRQILVVDAQHVGALHLLGLLAHQVGRSDLAVEYISQALRLQPEFAEAHSNLGMALAKQGKLTEAVACYQVALRIKPGHAAAHNNLANAFRKQGRLAEAVASYQQALRIKPDIAQTHCNLGVALFEQGKVIEAVACQQQAVRLKPNYAEAHSNLGMVLAAQGKLTEAVAYYQEALRIKPDLAEAHCNLGVALLQQGKLTTAVACFEHALRLKQDYAQAHSNLGVALAEQGRLKEAVACYQQALLLEPDYAEAHVNLAYFWFLLGNFEEGWPEFEWRWKRRDFSPSPFHQPLWDGSRLQGQTILLFAEQGLGDTLHFIRYASLVQQNGATVIVRCQAPLLRLLATCAGIDRLAPEGTALPPFDVQAPLLSLPRIFRSNLATIPANIPYLSADPELRAHWQQQLSGVGEFKVGITWQGNPEHLLDRRRSVPLLAFEPLADVPGVRLVSLQKGPGREQLPDVADHLGVLDLADRLEDFADTAAVMSNLDLVITVDTAVAHLAGALGIPVWVALPVVPDWRWLLDREDSPWYPSMRLFRQRVRGDWEGVFERLAEALREQVEATEGIMQAQSDTISYERTC
jgi:tetratricopeptide (TPR) repeat protein